MGKKHKSATNEPIHDENTKNAEQQPSPADDAIDTQNENPPRTTTGGWFTTPKFGSSTSGGGEIEPGPERD